MPKSFAATNDVKPTVGDRVTFNSVEGTQAGYVVDIRRDIGNGQAHAWIELDHEWTGMFQAVPLIEILTADGLGRVIPYVPKGNT